MQVAGLARPLLHGQLLRRRPQENNRIGKQALTTQLFETELWYYICSSCAPGGASDLRENVAACIMPLPFVSWAIAFSFESSKSHGDEHPIKQPPICRFWPPF
jgi:hypothetical protein